MTKQKIKSIISLLVSLAMVCSLCAAPAFADEVDAEETATSYVASVTKSNITDSYTTIEDAVKAANDKENATITLLSDVNAEGDLYFGLIKKLDLAGYTLSCGAITIGTVDDYGSGSLTIKECTGTINCSGITVAEGSSLTISSDVTIISTGTSLFSGYGTVNSLTTGTFSHDVKNYCADGYTTQQVTLSDNTTAYKVVKDASVAQIGSTTYNSISEALSEAANGDTVTLIKDVSDEAVTYSNTNSVTLDLAGYAVDLTSLSVTAGTLTVTDSVGSSSASDLGTITATSGTLKIIGGTYSSDPSDYLPAGYSATESNGAYTVAQTAATFTIGSYDSSVVTVSGVTLKINGQTSIIINDNNIPYTYNGHVGDTIEISATATVANPNYYTFTGWFYNTDGTGSAVADYTSNADGSYSLSFTIDELKENTAIYAVCGKDTDRETACTNWLNGYDNNTTFTIGSVTDWQNFVYAVNVLGYTFENKTVQLAADLDFSTYENKIEAVGTATNKFMGTFDGNNKTISNMKYESTTAVYVGVFGVVSGAIIKNLTVEDCTFITDEVNIQSYAGGIVADAQNSSVIENCTVTNVTVQGWFSGGIAGHTFSSTFNNVEATGVTFASVAKSACIVGYAEALTINGATVISSLTSDSSSGMPAAVVGQANGDETLNNLVINAAGLNVIGTMETTSTYTVTIDGDSTNITAAAIAGNYSGSNATLAVSAGTYSFDVGEYVVDGKDALVNSDGTYTVTTGVAAIYDANGDCVSIHETLSAAFSAVSTGETIKLLGNVTETNAEYNGDGYYQVSGKVVTLDLGGHTLSVDTTRILGVKNGGTLNVENGTIEIAEGTTATYNQFNMVRGNSTFTATGVTFNANNIGGYAVYIAAGAKATVEMTNCIFKDLNNAVVFDADNASTVTLTGCTYNKQPFSTSTFNTIDNYTIVITKNSPSTDCYEDNNTIFFNYVVEDGGVIEKDTISLSKYFGAASLTVKDGGTVKANVKVNDDTSMTVNGGTVTGTITVAKEGDTETNTVLLASAEEEPTYTITGGLLTIAGGTITGQVKSSGTLIMTDGTVTDDGTGYADGVIYILNGNVYVSGGTVTGTKRGFGFASSGTIGGEISGGSITGSDIALMVRANESNSVKVSGGSYTATNALYLANESDESTIFADGYSAYNTAGTALTATDSNGVALYKSALSDKTVVVYMTGAVATVTKTDGTTEYYKTLQEAIDATSSGDKVTLLTDVTENTTVESKKNFTLDLAGHTLTGNGDYAIDVEGGTFTLKDSVGNGIVTRSDASGYVIYITSSKALGKAVFTMESGTITGGTSGGIYARGGTSTYKSTVNINGGTITDTGINGVYAAQYTDVTMTGGTISENQRGVFLASTSYPSTFTMSGGTISNNTSETLNGGGVYAVSGNKFVMTGGVITGNKAAIGGGVYAETKSNTYYFKFSGGAIYGNTAVTSGNDIYATNVNTYNNATIMNASAMTGVSYNSWRSASDGTNVTDTTKLSGTVYLTAATGDETYDTYTVTYDANGGSGTVPTDSNAYTSGRVVTTLSGDGLTMDGYYFNGWNTAADGSGTTYAVGSTFVLTGDTTLYAVWQETVAVVLDSTNTIVGYYSSLSAAVKGASSGQTVQLMKDITIASYINIQKVITIDLNGHNITYSSSSTNTNQCVFYLSYSGSENTLTLTNSQSTGGVITNNSEFNSSSMLDMVVYVARGHLVVESGVTLTSTNGYAIYLGGYTTAYNNGTIQATVTIDGGTVEGGLVGIAVYGDNKNTSTYGPVLTVNSGSVTGSDFAITGNGTSTYGPTTIYINGGTISATTGTGIYHPQNGTLTVTGGEITGPTGIEMRSGTLNVSGGTITGTAESFTKAVNGNGTTVDGAGIAVSQHSTNNEIEVNITGGEISGYYGIYEWNTFAGTNTSAVTINISEKDADTAPTVVKSTIDDGTAVKIESVDGETTDASSITTVAISGGSFSSAVPEAYCADGYVPTEQLEDNTYSVTPFTLGISGSAETVPATIASGKGTSTMYVLVSAANIKDNYSETAYPTTDLTITDSGNGYVFGGWYSYDEEAGTYSELEAVPTTDDAYAKFVDASLMDVICYVTNSDGTYYWRFITSLDNLDYLDGGFEAYCGNEKVTLMTTEFYGNSCKIKNTTAKVEASSDGTSSESNMVENPTVYKTDFGSLASCLVSACYMDTEESVSTLTVTPYWVTVDGTTVYGETYTFNYSYPVSE